MIYLAAPYSMLEDKDGVLAKLNYYASVFLRLGVPVYSPLIIGHYAGLHHDAIFKLPAEHWRELEKKVIPLCSALFVIRIGENYLVSSGVRHELKLASQYNIPIIFLD